MTFINKSLILFDLDGTLIDSVPDLAKAINRMLLELGREPFSEEVIRYWVGNGAQILVKRALSGDREIDASIDSTFFEQALELFLSFYSQDLCTETKPYPHVIETVHALNANGYRLAIVTNKPIEFVRPILEGVALQNLFEFSLGGNSLEKKKPDPLPLLYTCQKLEVPVENAIMVGDSSNDILAAKAANMQSIGVSYGYNYGEDIDIYSPDIILNDLSEILLYFR